MAKKHKGRRRQKDRGKFHEQKDKGKSSKGRSANRQRAGRGVDQDALREALLASPGLSAAQLVAELGWPSDQSRAVGQQLQEWRQAGQVIELRPGKFALSGHDGEFPALVERSNDGNDLMVVLEEREVRIDPAHSIGAEAGDRVLVMVDDRGLALVTRIVNRYGRGLPGSLNFEPYGIVFIPDNRREGPFDVISAPPEVLEAYQAGDRVVGRLVDNEHGERVIELLRNIGDDSPEIADFDYVSLVHDLPGEFPPAVNKEAETADPDFAVGKRMDLREQFIFTIDPETAKDFDDAISIEERDDGLIRIGVHIADVSHFVRGDTGLDTEALRRGTSIYLVNRVIPMLPEALSNGLCSLVPHTDRYALSVFIDLDREWKVVNVQPAETIINSKHRLSYEEALAIIEKREPADAWPKQLLDTIRTCHHVAQNLRKERFRQGAISLYSVERRFILDADGHPVDIEQESGDVAHELIEEYMLLANRCIAKWLHEKGYQQVFRVHGEPDEERLEEFAGVLERYGIGPANVFERRALQNMLKRLEKEPVASRLVLNFLCLRSFQKAVYSVDNVGHYALAFKYYVHFTSPIRRYPDLIIHRLVKHALGIPGYGNVVTQKLQLDAHARQCSFLEQRAEQSERDLKSIKSARYLSDRLGQSFAGVVVGVTQAGVFVQMLETGLDGFVPLREMNDDYYVFDRERQCLVGERNGQVLGVGHECEVAVISVDILRGEVTLAFDTNGARKAKTEPAKKNNKKGKKRQAK